MGAQGFVLDIPVDLLNRLYKADEKIKDLAETSEQTSKRIIAAFEQINSQGIQAFINKLAETKRAILDVGSANVQFNGVVNISNQSTQAADNVVNLVSTLARLKGVLNESPSSANFVSKLFESTEQIKTITQEIRKGNNWFKKLSEETDKYAVSIDKLPQELQRAKEAHKQFNEQMKQMATQQVGNLATKQGTAKTLNELKAYAKELRNTMANLDPKSSEWEKLNKIYKQTNREIKSINSSMKDMNNTHKSLINTADQLKRAFALMFSVSAIKGYVTQIARVRGEFELQQRSLQAILQNKDKANELWEQTVALAIRSPFRVKELVTYTKQLAAYRVESDKLYDTTKMLADVSAGLGVDMQRLILAFGQVKAANYLRGTELRQFSEAGINILGELAEYFSEIEGRAVSVGQVFERVSKRMVTFGDVEEIFKRITSEGGLFYKMQEIQAETLQGQISNLRDALDLMLNDIGKSNEGVFKMAVSSAKTLINNWRVIATIMEEVFGGIALIGIAGFAKGLKATGDALTLIAVEGTGATKAAAKLKIALTSLWSVIVANPYLALGAAIAGVVYALYKYNVAIDNTNKKYDEMSQSELRRVETLEEINNKIEENNKVIADSKTKQEELNKAKDKNQMLLSQIKKDYPLLNAYILENKDGTVSLTEAIEEQNKQMTLNIALRQQAKSGAFQDDLATNYAEAIESRGKLESRITKVKSAAIELRVELETLASQELISAKTREDLSSLIDQLRKSKDFGDVATAFNAINNYANQLSGDEFYKVSDAMQKIRSESEPTRRAFANFWSSLKNLFGNLNNQMSTYIVGVKDRVDLDPVNGAKKAAEWVDSQLEALGIVDAKIREYAREKIAKEVLATIGIELVWTTKSGAKEYTEADLTDEWQKQVWNAIKKVQDTNPELRIGTTIADIATKDKDELLSSLRKAVESLQKENATTIAIGDIDTQIAKTKEQIKAAKSAVEPLQKLADLIGLISKKTTSKDPERRIQEQVSLIKEMNKEYEKLKKTYSEIDATEIVRNSYKDTAKTVGLDISRNLFSGTGTIAALNTLLEKTPITLQKAIKKALDNYNVEVNIEAKIKDDKQLQSDVEALFSQYELSIDFEKLGFNKDMMQKFFNVEYLDIDALKTRLNELKPRFVGDDMLDEWDKYEKKLTGIERKAQQERLITYLEYARETIGERAKIKLEELRKLAEIEKTFTKSEQAKEKEAAQTAVKEESYQETQKLEWQEFQKTDTFINLFKDLDSASSTLINHAITKLNEFKNEWEDMPLEDMRSIVSKINELEMKLASTDPFNFAKELRANGAGELGALEKLQNEAIDKENKLLVNERELAIYEEILRLKQEGKELDAMTLALDNDRVDLLEESADSLSYEIQQRKDISKDLKKQLNDNAKKQANEKALAKAYQSQAEALGDAQKMANDLLDSFIELAEVLGAEDSVGVVFAQAGQDMLNTVLNTIMLQIQLNAATVAAEGLGLAMNAAMGIIGWIVMAVQLLVTALTAIFQAKDKALQRQIDELAEDVEVLREKFDKLVDSIDEVYTTDKLLRINQQLKENTRLTIENYKAQLALQRERKQTDKVRDEIAELEEQIAEAEKDLAEALEDSFSKSTAGIFDNTFNVARGFVDAWDDAFKETGNGLKGLEDNFEEMFMDLAKQQAAMQIVGKFAAQWEADLNKYLGEGDTELTKEEAQAWAEEVKATFPELNEALEGFLGVIHNGLSTTGQLSGLEEGIAGASEETVQIVAAYLNSIRFFVSENNSVLKQLRDYAIGTNDDVNPLLAQLRIVAQQTTAIRNLLDSVTMGGDKGQGLRVYMP